MCARLAGSGEILVSKGWLKCLMAILKQDRIEKSTPQSLLKAILRLEKREVVRIVDITGSSFAAVIQFHVCDVTVYKKNFLFLDCNCSCLF